MKYLVYGTFVLGVTLAHTCIAAPQPAIVPSPDDWTVDLTFEHPQQIVCQRSDSSEPQRFWYVILTLTNRTSHDVDFYYKCELMTNTYQIVPAGKDVTPAVFENIKRRHQSSYPFLEALESTSSRLLQGEDNTKDIAVVWPDFDPEAKKIKVFVTGLSNETVAIDHPIAKDKGGEPLKVLLRKTLELSYSLHGDPAFRSDTKLTYRGSRWIMR